MEMALRVHVVVIIFCQIFPDVLHRFLQSFQHMSALWVHMRDLYIIFRFGKGRCHGNQIMLGEMRK